MGERAGKHITFEKSCSSGGSSDDDGNAVEVTPFSLLAVLDGSS